MADSGSSGAGSASLLVGSLLRGELPREEKKFRNSNLFTSRVLDLLRERQQPTEAQPSAPDAEVELYYFSPEKLEHKKTTNLDDIIAEHPDWASVVWINVDGISEKVLRKLALEFSLHPIAVEDVVEIQHRPKLDFFGDTLFLITSIISKGSAAGKSTLETEQVSFFLIGKTLITIQQGLPGDVWETVRDDIADQESLVRQGDGSFLLYALLTGIVDTCKPIVDELDDALEDLEVLMMEKPSNNLNKMVYAVKRHQITLRSILLPTRKIMHKILPSEEGGSGENETGLHHSAGVLPHKSMRAVHTHKKPTAQIISPLAAPYFRDLYGVLNTLCEQIESQKEVVSSLGSLYTEHQALRQGTASYAIAIVSVFFLPLTFIAGVYGMNFVNIPELSWDLGYLYVWMVFLGIVLFEIVIFWGVGWIEFKFTKRVRKLVRKAQHPINKPRKKYSTSNSLIPLDMDDEDDK